MKRLVLYLLSLAISLQWVPVVRGQDTLTGSVPPGVIARHQTDGVWRFDRPAGPQPGFWQQALDLFSLKPAKAVPFRRSVAFLVGVGRYAKLPQLPFVDSDLTDLRNLLLTDGGFDTVYEVRNESVHRSLIEAYMVAKFSVESAELGSEDRFLFYYSGHGADQAGHIGYLQFAKAIPGYFVGDEVLPLHSFQDWAQLNIAKHLLIILDACASGLAISIKGSVSPQAALNALSGQGSGFLLTAGTGDQEAFTIQLNKEKGYSIFTRAIIDALRDGTADTENTGFFTINEVFGHAQKYVGQFEAEQNRRMDPQIWPLTRKDGPAKGTFVFLNPRARNPKISPQYATVLVSAKGEAGNEKVESSRTGQLAPAPAQSVEQPKYTKEQIDEINRQRERAININAVIAQAQSAMNAKNWQEALPLVQQLVASDPANWQFYQALGNTQFNLGHYEEAADAYAKGVQAAENNTAVDPKNPATDPAKKKAGMAQMLTNEGNADLKLHKNNEAMAAFARATSLDPNPAIAYFNLCAIQYNTGNVNGALEACEKAIQFDPNKADAYYIKGSLLIADSKVDKNGKVTPAPGTAEALWKYLELAPNGSHANDVKQMLAFIGSRVRPNSSK